MRLFIVHPKNYNFPRKKKKKYCGTRKNIKIHVFPDTGFHHYLLSKKVVRYRKSVIFETPFINRNLGIPYKIK